MLRELNRKSRTLLLSCGLAIVLPAALVACKRSPSREEISKQLASALSASASAPRQNAPEPPPPPDGPITQPGVPRIPHIGPPTGPVLAILPGQGLGPIRFGATVATIERLMEAPCDEKSETLCRYIPRSAEFRLEGGAVKEIHVYRKGRTAKLSDKGEAIEYGFFQGAIPPDYYFGMLPMAIQETIGKPERIEKIEPQGPDGQAERHFYPGITCIYDRWSNGNLVLGEVILTKHEKPVLTLPDRVAELKKSGKAPRTAATPR